MRRLGGRSAPRLSAPFTCFQQDLDELLENLWEPATWGSYGTAMNCLADFQALHLDGAAGVKVGDVWDPSGRDTFAEDGWIALEQIMAMLHKARNGNKRDKECAAIAIFAFFAIARLSEVFDHGGVRWSRVTILENGDAVIRLPQSKTDVWREGTDLVIPAKWWTTIIALLGDSDEDKIFPRISRVAFLKWCQKFFTDKQAGHSFRRGGATHLWKLGVPLEVIKRKGRWVTDCVFLYVNTLVRDAESVASLV